MKHLPWHRGSTLAIILLMATATVPTPARGGVLDKQKLLDAQTFWDNRDWDWYKANIPFFESPDRDIDTTWYYRWELVTKHLTYGSPGAGYVYTEFIDRPFWSGRYGAISCPAGHQLYETRWAKDPRLSQDYARYWFRTEGAQPRRYSTWLADSVWAMHAARPDERFTKDLLPDLVRNYEQWERERFSPEVGLFWQTGHDDGMEYNINSRQSEDPNRGAPGYRPTLNAYMWADALAIERIARLAGDEATAERFAKKAAGLKENLQKKLWDPERRFFFHMARRDEHREGFKVEALSLTHQTGRFAGSEFGREQIGFVPWQFNLPDPGYEAAWQFLMPRDRFFSDFGPTTVEKQDPMYHLSRTCCWWSGMSWPYATTQTLVAMANLLNHYEQPHVTKDDYLKLLQIYAKTHRKDGKPYIAEAAHPDTGSWEGHDAYNHSEHYFHSGFTDLVITGLVGLRPRADDVIEVNPLAPEAWDYFALDDVAYHGRSVSVLWDRKGDRYRQGPGLHVLVDGKKLASSPAMTKLTAKLPPPQDVASPRAAAAPNAVAVNFAVNNDGTYFPRVSASHTGEKSSVMKLIDGNYWYHLHPPNRWTADGSPGAADWVAVDFGVKRPVHTVKLYLLDDGHKVIPPARYELEHWDGSEWAAVPGQTRTPAEPTGRRANVVRFPELGVEKLRVVLTHRAGGRSGLSELEAWGDAALPVTPAPAPKDNLALNDGTRPFPKASASHTSQYDQVHFANDGVVNFNPSPNNRWTSYESPNATDWLQIDFGKEKEVGRLELALYDDRGGVQAPKSYVVQFWDGQGWRDVPNPKLAPERPAGGQWNEVRFTKVKTPKVRVVFTHAGKARSGVTEILAWPS